MKITDLATLAEVVDDLLNGTAHLKISSQPGVNGQHDFTLSIVKPSVSGEINLIVGVDLSLLLAAFQDFKRLDTTDLTSQ
jgi:hypothetical protein